jgi:hypothetical protein
MSESSRDTLKNMAYLEQLAFSTGYAFLAALDHDLVRLQVGTLAISSTARLVGITKVDLDMVLFFQPVYVFP